MALLEVKTEWAVGFVESNGLGEDTGRTVRSGYCTYPVVKLNVEKIGEYLEGAEWKECISASMRLEQRRQTI